MPSGFRRFIRSLYCFNTPEGEGGGGSGSGTSDSIPTAEVTPGINLGGNDSGDSENDGASTGSGDLSQLIPEEYREKPYIQNILKSDQPHNELFKQFDNAQKLIGQKTLGIPDENATPEEIQEFNRKLGVPENASDYEIPQANYEEADKDLGDFLNKNRGSDEFMTDLRGLFKEAGLTAKQAKVLAPGYEQLLVKHNRQEIEEMKSAMGALDTDFNAKVEKMFGAEKDKALEIGQKTIKAALPEDLRQDMRGWTSDELTKVATVLYHVNKKFLREDSFDGEGTSATPQSREDMRQKAMDLMASPAFNDPMHVDNAKVKAEVRELYKQAEKTK